MAGLSAEYRELQKGNCKICSGQGNKGTCTSARVKRSRAKHQALFPLEDDGGNDRNLKDKQQLNSKARMCVYCA